MVRSTVMYCHKINGIYRHFYQSQIQVGMCGKYAIYKVHVTETKESDDCYWAWWKHKQSFSKTEYFSIVNYNKMGVEICFIYGSASEEKVGKGLLLPVEIKEVQLC